MSELLGTAVLVTGNTDWDDIDAIAQCLVRHPMGSILIQGGASGADQIAVVQGTKLHYYVTTVPYAGHLGRRGGPARNRVLVRLLAGLRAIGYDCYAYAFGDGAGTRNCIEQAHQWGFVVERQLRCRNDIDDLAPGSSPESLAELDMRAP